MNKTALFLTCAILSLNAKVKTFDDQPPILASNELSLEQIQEFTHAENSSFTIAVKEGLTVPLQFLMKTTVFSALLDPNLTLSVDRTFYLRVVDKKCYLSQDLVNWEKASKFLNGSSAVRLVPSTNKPGLTLETEIVPYSDDSTDE